MLINLTPHTITIICPNNKIIVPPSGKVARCAQEYVLVDTIEDISIYTTAFGEVSDLPAPKEHTIYIVSSIVAFALKGKRNDVFIPVDFVRDKTGNIIGCKGLARV